MAGPAEARLPVRCALTRHSAQSGHAGGHWENSPALPKAPDNQRTLRELNFAYADVTEVSPSDLRWDQVVLDRTNTRWHELVSLAKLFLGGRHQQTSFGDTQGFALLFEMNVLFEAYMTRLMAWVLADTGLRISAQGGLRACFYKGETDRFRTRPRFDHPKGQSKCPHHRHEMEAQLHGLTILMMA